jgi:hypothetical protein
MNVEKPTFIKFLKISLTKSKNAEQNKEITTQELFEIVKALSVKDNDGEVNLTPIAEAFDKRIDNWKRLQGEFLEELSLTQIEETEIIRIKQAGNSKEQGTFTKLPEVLDLLH